MGAWFRFLSPSDDSDDREMLAATRAVPGVRVEVHGLNKFFGPKHVLRDLTLTVEPGETFVIFGPSGCGKSVLLKYITGLIVPDSGRILVDGEEFSVGAGGRRFRMAMVFQSSALFNSLSVGENVGLWLKEHRICGADEIARAVAVLRHELERGAAARVVEQLAALATLNHDKFAAIYSQRVCHFPQIAATSVKKGANFLFGGQKSGQSAHQGRDIVPEYGVHIPRRWVHGHRGKPRLP